MPYTTQQHLPYAPQSDTSHEAAVRAQRFVGKQGERVYSLLACNRADEGLTQKEVAARLDVSRASVCARMRALEQAWRIEKIPGVKREGCAAYRLYRPPNWFQAVSNAEPAGPR